MALTKKLSKLGTGRALMLTQETLSLLGVGDDDEVVFEFVGDTLLIRRHDAARPSALDLIAGLERLSDTIQLAPEHAELSNHLRPESRQRLLLHLLHNGSSTAAEITEGLGASRDTINATLRRLTQLGVIERDTSLSGPNRYRLAADKFLP